MANKGLQGASQTISSSSVTGLR